MIVYYAHCLQLYGTKQEQRDLETLRGFGFQVTNPADDAYAKLAKTVKQVYANPTTDEERALVAPFADAGEAVMQLVFRGLVCNCDALVFRALPDGRIPAGVAQEIAWANLLGKPVIELPTNLLSRTMTVDQTREYLRLVGQR